MEASTKATTVLLAKDTSKEMCMRWHGRGWWWARTFVNIPLWRFSSCTDMPRKFEHYSKTGTRSTVDTATYTLAANFLNMYYDSLILRTNLCHIEATERLPSAFSSGSISTAATDRLRVLLALVSVSPRFSCAQAPCIIRFRMR